MMQIIACSLLSFSFVFANKVLAETQNKRKLEPVASSLNEKRNDNIAYLDVKAINDGYQASLEAMFKHFVNSAENAKSTPEFFSKLWFLDLKDKKTQAVIEKKFKEMKTPKLKKVMNGFIVDMGDGQPLTIESGHRLGELRINGELHDTFEQAKKQSSSAPKTLPVAFVLLGVDSAFAGKLDLVLHPIKFLDTAFVKSMSLLDMSGGLRYLTPKEVVLETLQGWTRFGAAGAVGGCIAGTHIEGSDCKEGALVGAGAGLSAGVITTSVGGLSFVFEHLYALKAAGKLDKVKKLTEMAQKIGLVGLTIHGGNELATMNGMELVCEENGSFRIYDLKNKERNINPTYSVQEQSFKIKDENSDHITIHNLNKIESFLKARFPKISDQDKVEYDKSIAILAEGYRSEISALKKICVDHGDNYTHKFIFDDVAKTGKSSMENKIYNIKPTQSTPATR